MYLHEQEAKLSLG